MEPDRAKGIRERKHHGICYALSLPKCRLLVANPRPGRDPGEGLPTTPSPEWKDPACL